MAVRKRVLSERQARLYKKYEPTAFVLEESVSGEDADSLIVCIGVHNYLREFEIIFEFIDTGKNEDVYGQFIEHVRKNGITLNHLSADEFNAVILSAKSLRVKKYTEAEVGTFKARIINEVANDL